MTMPAACHRLGAHAPRPLCWITAPTFALCSVDASGSPLPSRRRSFIVGSGAALWAAFFSLTLPVDAQPLLTPIGTILSPSSDLEQITFDAASGSLYISDVAGGTIVKVLALPAAPLTPASGATWTYVTVAGIGWGPASSTEVRPSEATFNFSSGIAGWPQYAVGPNNDTTTSAAWVGLWIADCYNNVVRFINFGRGNNVTLVAGSNTSQPGAADGIGAAALLRTPMYLTWGRFHWSTANEGAIAAMPSADRVPWTTVVYWSEYEHHCVRQGVPLHHNLSAAPTELLNMMLNVSTFAGVCGTNYGNGTGRTFNRTGLFRSPFGVALVVPSMLTAARGTPGSAAVLFVGDHLRVSMIAPMYPSRARYLITIYTTSNTVVGFYGVSIGRVRMHLGDVVAVDVIVATNFDRRFLNLSLMLHYDAVQGGTVLQAGSVVTGSTLINASSMFTHQTALLRYSPNASYTGTLVVFSGWGGDVANAPVLQFFCCLGVEYSEPLGVQDWSGILTRTHRITGSASVSTASRTPGTLSGTAALSTSMSRMLTPTPNGGVSNSSTLSSATCTITKVPKSVPRSGSMSASQSRTRRSADNATATASFIKTATHSIVVTVATSTRSPLGSRSSTASLSSRSRTAGDSVGRSGSITGRSVATGSTMSNLGRSVTISYLSNFSYGVSGSLSERSKSSSRGSLSATKAATFSEIPTQTKSSRKKTSVTQPVPTQTKSSNNKTWSVSVSLLGSMTSIAALSTESKGGGTWSLSRFGATTFSGFSASLWTASASRSFALGIPVPRSLLALTTASTSTATVLGGMSFISTTPVLVLQRINSVSAAAQCSMKDPNSRPSKVANPTGGALEMSDGPTDIRPALAPYWRLSWWWLLGEGTLCVFAFVGICLAETAYLARMKARARKAPQQQWAVV